MSVEWPAGRDEAANSSESTIAIPYSNFLKMIVSPTVGRTVKPTLELTTVGENSVETRCPLIDGIRASTVMDRELVERFSQAIASYPLLDHYAAIDLVANSGTTVEKAFSDEDWMLYGVAVIGSYPIPYPTTAMFLLSKVLNNYHNLYMSVSSHTLPYVRLTPGYPSGTAFEGAYDDTTDTLRGSMAYYDTSMTDVVATRFNATPVNQSIVPNLIQGRAVLMAFDVNNVGSLRPATTSAVGSADYVNEGLELWQVPLNDTARSFRAINSARSNGVDAACLGVNNGNRYFIWVRTTSAATSIQSP